MRGLALGTVKTGLRLRHWLIAVLLLSISISAPAFGRPLPPKLGSRIWISAFCSPSVPVTELRLLLPPLNLVPRNGSLGWLPTEQANPPCSYSIRKVQRCRGRTG